MRKSWCKSFFVPCLSIGLTIPWNFPVYAQSVAQAECRSGFGETACGYNCIAANGKVRCADWPGGVCKAAYNNVVCGPFAPIGWEEINLSSVPKAECYAAEGQIACGYNCVGGYGLVGCAEWPKGVCQVSSSGVICEPVAPTNWISRYGYTPERRRRRIYIYPFPLSEEDCIEQLLNSGESELDARISCRYYYDRQY